MGDDPGPHLCEGRVRSRRRAQDPGPVQAHAALAMGQVGRDPAERRRHLAGLRPEGRPARRLEDDQPGDDRSPAARARRRHAPVVRAPWDRARARRRGSGRQHQARPRPRRRRRQEDHRPGLHRRLSAEGRQRLELSAAGHRAADPDPRLALPRRADARGLRRQRSRRGDLSERLGRRRRQAADRQEPLRHPFRQGRRAQGQGVLVGDHVQPSSTISSPIRSTAIRSATARA